MRAGHLRFGLLSLCVTAGILLVSCGGGGGGGSSGSGGGGGAVITGNFYPLDSGGRWFYASNGLPSSSVRVVGPGTAGPVSGTLVETVDESNGAVIDQSVYTVAADGVRQYALSVGDPITQALDGLHVLRYPLQAGSSYVLVDTTIDLGQDFDGDGRNERLTLHVETTVVGLETVTTPAGNFPGSLHQRQVIRQSVRPTGGSGTVSATITIDDWYGPDIGPLQSTVRVTASGGVDETEGDALVAYGVGSRRSESVAPTVQSVTPGATPVRPPNATVTAVFSEAMDRSTISDTSFTVRDSAGALISGFISLQGTTATFTPAAFTWASGTYTAMIDGAKDQIGNPMAAPRLWTFVVDDTAPGVVASNPAPGAVDVALGTIIVVDFSEAIDPARVIAANVTLVDDLGATQTVGLALAGSRLTVTPAAPLMLGRTYQLQLRGQADLLGNPMADYVLSFKSRQGRFAFPVELIAGVRGYSQAIGDVNGDGRADVLVSTLSDAPAPYQLGLFLLAGRADGTLAAPLRIDVGAASGACPIEAIAIGDADGDGRADVMTGSATCGIQVLRQSAAGTLGLAEHLATSHAGRLRLADLDGDGRLDLIGAGGTDSIGIWKRGPSGALAESGTFLSGSFNVVDFDVGDLNGDGRPDLAFALSSGQPGADLAVVFQQSNGSFAGSTILATGSIYGSARVAIADLNGDGRADLAATAVDRVVVYYQGAGGSLGPVTTLATLISGNSLASADMNNDGRPDLVVGHLGESRIGVYYQQAGGSLAAEELYVAPPLVVSGLQPFALGDATSDGQRDLVVNGTLLRQHSNGGLAALGSAERKLPAARLHPGRLGRIGISGQRPAAPASPPPQR